jgi:hypothetical protein
MTLAQIATAPTPLRGLASLDLVSPDSKRKLSCAMKSVWTFGGTLWQYFSSQAYYEPLLPYDTVQTGRFRRAIGEEGLEQLLKVTIETAVEIKAIKPTEFARIRTQQRHDKNKLYTLHAPDVECIAKGKARKPCGFGVKVSLAVSHKSGLMGGAGSFTGNPFDGYTILAQLEQTTNLLQELNRLPTQVMVDLCYRGVHVDNPAVETIRKGRYQTMTDQQKRWLKRRQVIEPMIGHAKSENRMVRCGLQGALGMHCRGWFGGPSPFRA